MVGSLERRARWAGARSCTWTTVRCTRQRWSSTCSTSRRCSRSFAAVSYSPRAPSASSGGRSSASSATASRRRTCRRTRARCSPSYADVALRSAALRGWPTTTAASWRGYSEVAALLTALGSPTARFVWTPAAQASFDALKLALSSTPVLHTFDPARRAVLTTDASNVAVAAILTQPDDEVYQGHPVAYKSRKLTAAEQNYPAHVLELLAVVHALRVFRHILLGGGAPRPGGCWSDFDLRTDNQAITWLKTKRHLNKMYVRWLDEIEDFRFDVTHLPRSRNPTDPLSRRGFADGADPAASTGDADAESQ
jgi:hypothetical protein